MFIGRNKMIKLLIAAILFTLFLPCLCGCSVLYQRMAANTQSAKNYPDDAQIQAYVESVVKGEKVQSVYGGGTEYRSLDRDLTFEVRVNSLTTSLDGSFARETGEYYFTDTYELMVAAFWQDEFDAALNRRKFDYCFCNGPSELYPGSTGVEVYIDEDCSEEQLEEVENLLLDLRDICIKEEKYHTSDLGYSYDANIYWVDPKTDMITSADGNGAFKITAATTDAELKMDAFPKSNHSFAGPAKQPQNAYGFILQCGPSRQNMWQYY